MILIVRNPPPAPRLPLSLRRRTGGVYAFAVVRMAPAADCLTGSARPGSAATAKLHHLFYQTILIYETPCPSFPAT